MGLGLANHIIKADRSDRLDRYSFTSLPLFDHALFPERKSDLLNPSDLSFNHGTSDLSFLNRISNLSNMNFPKRLSNLSDQTNLSYTPQENVWSVQPMWPELHIPDRTFNLSYLSYPTPGECLMGTNFFCL